MLCAFQKMLRMVVKDDFCIAFGEAFWKDKLKIVFVEEEDYFKLPVVGYAHVK